MKIFFFADLHLDPSTAENTEPAMGHLLAAARRERPDLIVNAGDLSMRRGYLAPWVSLALRRFHVELSRIAPTIVVAGNHDLSTAGRGVGTVLGALELSAAWATGGPSISLFEQPGLMHACGLAIAALPYPHRDWLLAARPDLKPSEVLPMMSRLLLEALNGLAAQVPPSARAILVYHGSIAGARTDSEQTMTPELDVVLNEADIPACFELVLCGHIHRHQVIGRAVYAGSPAPLTFAEERGAHGYVMLDDKRLGDWECSHVAIPVAHPLVTVDLRAEGAAAAYFADPPRCDGARVRVMLRQKPLIDDDLARRLATEKLVTLGASEVRVLIERPEEARTAGPEVRADASMAGLLALYCERHPEAAALLADLTEHAAMVEALLPPDARMRAASAGYRLLRLRWDNWKSYGVGNRIDFDDLGRLVCIEGENASGKSNAAEVESFALYGRFIRGRQSLAEAVRIGQSEAMVAAEFEVAGERWKVERRIRINAKGVGSQVLALFRQQFRAEAAVGDPPSGQVFEKLDLIPDGWVPASFGTARETQELIEQLVGPFDLYCKTRFASQGEIDALLDLSPAELKDVLQQALAAELFVAREALARPIAAEAAGLALKHEAGLAAWREEAETLDGRRVTLAAAAEALKAARIELEEAEAGVERAGAAAARANEALASVEARRAEWDRAALSYIQAREKVLALEADLEKINGQIIAAADATAKLEALPGLMERLRVLRDAGALRAARRGALDAAWRLASERERAIEQHREGRVQARNEALAALGGLEEARGREVARETRALESAKANGERLIEAAIEALKEAERRAALAERAPFGEKCVEVACPLLADAIAARGQIEGRRVEIETARISASNLQSQADDAAGEQRAKFDAERARLAAEAEALADPHAGEGALVAAYDEAMDSAGTAEETLAEVSLDEVGLRRLEAEAAALEALRPAVERGRDARAAKPLLARSLAEAEAALEAIPPTGERPDAGEAAGLVAQAAEGLASAANARELAVGATERAIEAQAEARVRVERAEECAGKILAAAAEGEQLARAARVAAVYLAAVGRDGLPYLMLERALPALEGHANHFLCDDLGSGLRIEIEAARELQSGATRSEVLIRYANDFGTHSLAAASGFERTAIGYALRAALAQVQSEAQGVTLSHWIADEGWGVFDEANIVRVAQPMLRRLAERFGRVIVISHQAPIREVCDTRLCVIADPRDGSRIERAA